MKFYPKENFDRKIVDYALQKISENEAKELKTHFIYARRYYYSPNTLGIEKNRVDKLRSFILKAMNKYKLNSVMVTAIRMFRHELITKEMMEKYCEGNFGNNSVNDDLESLFEDIRLNEKPDEEVWTYYLPKLTKEELRLVEIKDASYLETFRFRNPDVSEAEMKLSESDSKFVRGIGWRKTFTIENSSSQNYFN